MAALAHDVIPTLWPFSDMTSLYYVYRLPHQFNRNPTAVGKVGICRGEGDGNCVYILICTNTVAVIFHNKNHRYTQQKVLPLLPNTDFIYTDNILYRLPGGCHHSLIDDCLFDRTAKVRDASAYIKSKRGLKCDQVCAKYNQKDQWIREINMGGHVTGIGYPPPLVGPLL